MAAEEPPQHPGYQALYAATDGPLRAVVEHHRPHPVMSARGPSVVGYWQCHGCDPGPRFEDWADWPCSTIEIVSAAASVSIEPAEATR